MRAHNKLIVSGVPVLVMLFTGVGLAIAGNWTPKTKDVYADASGALFQIPKAAGGTTRDSCKTLVIRGALGENSKNWEKINAVTFSKCEKKVRASTAWTPVDENGDTAKMEIPASGIEIELAAGCFILVKKSTIGMAGKYANGNNEDEPSSWDLRGESLSFTDPANCEGGAEKKVTSYFQLNVNNREAPNSTINVH